MDPIKHDKGTIQIDQNVFTNYKISSNVTFSHRKTSAVENFEINKPMTRDELYALKVVLDYILKEE